MASQIQHGKMQDHAIGHELNTKYHMGKSGTRIELEIIEEEKDLGVFIRS
jgi:hypothetical protein